jgi:hypothetical protein
MKNDKIDYGIGCIHQSKSEIVVFPNEWEFINNIFFDSNFDKSYTYLCEYSKIIYYNNKYECICDKTSTPCSQVMHCYKNIPIDIREDSDLGKAKRAKEYNAFIRCETCKWLKNKTNNTGLNECEYFDKLCSDIIRCKGESIINIYDICNFCGNPVKFGKDFGVVERLSIHNKIEHEYFHISCLYNNK